MPGELASVHNLFICWSGERSKRVAEVLHGWLDGLYEGGEIKPFWSGEIDKGSLWHEALTNSLAEVKAGILCLTPENLDSKWLHFEAGMLAQKTRSRPDDPGAGPDDGDRPTLFPVFFGVGGNGLSGPLSHWQLTRLHERSDVERLVQGILYSLGGGSSGNPNERSLTRADWQKLEGQLATVGPEPISSVLPDLRKRFDRKTFNEPIDACLEMSWRARYAGTREVLAYLRAARRKVHGRVSPHVAEMYDHLVMLMDNYQMVMGSSFLGEASFRRRATGRLMMEPARRTPCEIARVSVLRQLGKILFPPPEPVQGEMARAYEGLRGHAGATYTRQFELEKLLRVLAPDQAPRSGESAQAGAGSGSPPAGQDGATQARAGQVREEEEAAVQREARALLPHLDGLRIGAEDLNRCRESDWAFDRMVYYEAQTRGSGGIEGMAPGWNEGEVFANARQAVRSVERECERLRASLAERVAGYLPLAQLDLHPLQFSLLALSHVPREKWEGKQDTDYLQRVGEALANLEDQLRKYRDDLDVSEDAVLAAEGALLTVELERLEHCAARAWRNAGVPREPADANAP